jgi:hypothetical protein
MLDLGGDQTSIIYTCNIPMCNSKENTQQVLKQLVEAQIIPQPMTTTTAVAPTTPRSMAIKMMNNEHKLLIVFILFFLSFKF